MTQPVDPNSGVTVERRSKERRFKERRLAARPGLPVPLAAPPARSDPASAAGDAAFAAQVLGQGGQKRGLKGGPPVLEAAKSAYLGAEWSGPQDRRKPVGKIAKTEI